MAVVGCAAGDLTSVVLLCNVGAAWRMTMKEMTQPYDDRTLRGWCENVSGVLSMAYLGAIGDAPFEGEKL